MTSKLEPIWLRDTGHIGIHGEVDGRTTYVRTIDDVMAKKTKFLAWMGYPLFLTMVLREHARLRSSAKIKVKRPTYDNILEVLFLQSQSL